LNETWKTALNGVYAISIDKPPPTGLNALQNWIVWLQQSTVPQTKIRT